MQVFLNMQFCIKCRLTGFPTDSAGPEQPFQVFYDDLRDFFNQALKSSDFITKRMVTSLITCVLPALGGWPGH
ncbi:hypothetical protein DESC_780281 [Desulfosarcina cetonica]|nr:hypothetical protein DESC_780281 [Desulfosarcina cetonica]